MCIILAVKHGRPLFLLHTCSRILSQDNYLVLGKLTATNKYKWYIWEARGQFSPNPPTYFTLRLDGVTKIGAHMERCEYISWTQHDAIRAQLSYVPSVCMWAEGQERTIRSNNHLEPSYILILLLDDEFSFKLFANILFYFHNCVFSLESLQN